MATLIKWIGTSAPTGFASSNISAEYSIISAEYSIDFNRESNVVLGASYIPLKHK